MTEPEATALAAAVERGRPLAATWEGPDAYGWLRVRFDGERGAFAGTVTERPFDVQSPFRERSEAWGTAAFVAFLRSLPREAVEGAGPPLRPRDPPR